MEKRKILSLLTAPTVQDEIDTVLTQDSLLARADLGCDQIYEKSLTQKPAILQVSEVK